MSSKASSQLTSAAPPLSQQFLPISCIFLLGVVSHNATYYLHFYALCIIVLAVWLIYLTNKTVLNGRLHVPTDQFSLLLIFFLFWVFVIRLWSPAAMISLQAAWSLAMIPLVYLAVAGQALYSPAAWLKGIWVFVLSFAIPLSAFPIVELLLSHQRAAGLFVDYSSYAALLNLLIIPLLVIYILGCHDSCHAPISSKKTKWLTGPTLWLLFAGFFATQSRGAGLALLASAMLVFLAVPVRLFSARQILKLLLIIASAYAFIKLLPGSGIRTMDLGSDTSAQCRIMIWQSAWEIYKDHPLFGTGLGTYYNYYPMYRNPLETCTSGSSAHNDYIQFLQEGGPLHLLLLFSIGAAVLFNIYKNGSYLRNVAADSRPVTTDAVPIITSSALLIAVSSSFAHAFVNFIFYNASIAILIGLYLATALTASGRISITTIALPINIRKKIVSGGLAVLVISSFLPTVLDFAAIGVFHNSSKVALSWDTKLGRFELEDPATIMSLANAYTAIRPNSATGYVVSGQMFSLLHRACLQSNQRPVDCEELRKRAIGDLQRVTELEPLASNYSFQLAQMLLSAESINESDKKYAEQLLIRSATLSPYAPQIHISLAQFYQKQERYNEAVEVLDAMRYWFPLIGPVWEQRILAEIRRIATLSEGGIPNNVAQASSKQGG